VREVLICPNGTFHLNAQRRIHASFGELPDNDLMACSETGSSLKFPPIK
jgi:hypothetical protein